MEQIKTLGGPVTDPATVCKYLNSKGWTLSTAPLDANSLANVLYQISNNSKLPPDTTVTIRAVVILLNESTIQSSAAELADVIANKVIETIAPTVKALDTTTKFLEASTTKQAEHLVTADNLLEQATNKLANIPSSPSPRLQPTSYANALKNHPTQTNNLIRPASAEEVKIQQCQALATCRILVSFSTEDPEAPKENTMEVTRALCKKINNEIKLKYESEELFGEEPTSPIPMVKGIIHLKAGGILVEMDSEKSVTTFQKFFPTTALQTLICPTANYKQRSYPLIFHFVPIDDFDPTNKEHIKAIEDEVGLPQGSILETNWIKKHDQHRTGQKVANLRVTCASAEAANTILTTYPLRIADHTIRVQKDICEPLRCNKCQRYGHVRADCKGTETCALCTSTWHVTAACTTRTQCCVSCGPSSTHPSTARSCPEFHK